MLVKVCGMRNAENIREIVALGPQYIGFIFYSKSKRFVGEDFDVPPLHDIPSSVKKIGVFVNESLTRLIEIVNTYKLDGVQLHGDESASYLNEIRSLLGSEKLIIKVFQVDTHFDFESCKDYTKSCNYFLFDTKSSQYGGTGYSFDWTILQHYKLNTPFFLSGGISLEDTENIVKLASELPMFHAVDINSRFETEPGVKNAELVEKFIANVSFDKLS